MSRGLVPQTASADAGLFEDTGLEYGDVLGAASTVVGYECDGCDFTYSDGLPYPTGSDGTPENFVIPATAPAAPFDRRTSVRFLPDHLPSELEYGAGRLLGRSDPAACERLAYGHAVLGTYTRGATVVTSGCTDWVHGLDGKSPAVEQVNRTILDRLG